MAGMKNRCWGCMELIDSSLQVCPHCGYEVASLAAEAIHMNPGTLLHSRFIIGKVIGYGGFGATYLAWDGKLQQKVAVKEYMPSEFSTRMPGFKDITIFAGDKCEQFHDGMRKFIDEARRLAKFHDEEGVVKVIDCFEENNTAYIIMEYLDGETLSEYLKKVGTIPEDDAIDMLRPIFESLRRVHDEGILHRDIAPDNIFITKDGRVKLIDFGASRYATTTHSRSLTVIVKPGFSPEEQYRSRGDQGPYTDVYSIAATLYKMITGKTPPDAMERRAKYENQNKDILVEPHRLIKRKITPAHEIAILNGLNVCIEDRTADIDTFVRELDADPPAKRKYGKIKKIDLYTMPLWFKVVVPTAIATIIAMIVLLATGIIKFSLFTEEIIIPEGIVQVPDVEDMGKIEATAMLEQTGLIVYYGKAVYTDYVTDSLVVSQDPFGGFYIERGGVVTICAAYGRVVEADYENGVATVPYVCDMTLEEALERLERAGLGEPVIEYVSDEYVIEGNICSQSIENGNFLNIGAVITIYVSTGPAAFDMPDVYNMPYAEAISLLEGYGLKTNVSMVNDPQVAIGNVASQSVAAGSPVKKGDQITIGVSSKATTIKVPNIAGMSQKDAMNALKNAGFTVNVLENYDSNVPAGTVISQTPAADTEQEAETLVTMFVSKGKQPVTITFDGNGGKTGKTSITAYYGDPIGELPGASRRGYDFAGWYTGSTGGSMVDASYVVNSTAGMTLYAAWSGGTYTLSFDAAGGSVSPTSVNLNVDSAYGTLPTPTRAGYAFEGWFTSPDGGSQVNSSTLMGDSSAIVYAHWRELYFTLNFNANGGTVSTTSVSVMSTQPYGTLPTPTRDYYTFSGWYTAASGGSAVSASTIMGNSDTTIYAQWNVNSYTLSFDADGGTVGEAARSVEYGATYGALPTPYKDYCTFEGWYAGSNKVSDNTVMDGANTTLTAHWSDNAIVGWVIETDVPADAKIVEEKWTYDHKYWQSGSSQSAPAGYTLDPGRTTSEWSDYGVFSGWSTTPVAESESRTVETYSEQVAESYNLEEWNYADSKGYHHFYVTQPAQYNSTSNHFHRTRTVSAADFAGYTAQGSGLFKTVNNVGAYNESGITGYLDGERILWFIVGTNYRTVTYYRYADRSLIYTYWYYQIRSEEGISEPRGDDYSNIVHYVKYQPK